MGIMKGYSTKLWLRVQQPGIFVDTGQNGVRVIKLAYEKTRAATVRVEQYLWLGFRVSTAIPASGDVFSIFYCGLLMERFPRSIIVDLI